METDKSAVYVMRTLKNYCQFLATGISAEYSCINSRPMKIGSDEKAVRI